MSNIPSDLKYAKSHEWLKVAADGTATVGITDYAQNTLGDITYVQVNAKVGATLKAGDSFGTVESVKAASDLFSPLSGTAVRENDRLADHPELVNQDPYGAGWMIELAMSDPAEVGKLLTAEQYEASLPKE